MTVNVLGIESSCDETSAAVLADGNKIVSNIVASQIALHSAYGGVVPELASRQHMRAIISVIDLALKEAHITLPELDGIAVTRGPGLVGALLVGLQAAKAIAYAQNLPIVGVNHLEGHLRAPALASDKPLPERHVALLVSGGHTALFLVKSFGEYTLMGSTRDDAAGEAFDKVAKLLSLGYPGGPIIEKLAQNGDPHAIAFPRALPRRDELDFSFSGLKTAVANHVRKEGKPEGQQLADLCASFQQAVVDVLVRKTRRAIADSRCDTVVASGGVLANTAVRSTLSAATAEANCQLFIPPISLCTDNAAMIAAAGSIRLARGERDGMDLNAVARLPLHP